jgi:hypothetical protein
VSEQHRIDGTTPAEASTPAQPAPGRAAPEPSTPDTSTSGQATPGQRTPGQPMSADELPPGAILRPVRAHRAPRYPVFVIMGAVVGLVVALLSSTTGPVDPSVGRGPLVGYLGLALGLLGGLLGGLVAVVVERVVNGKD